VTRFQKVGNVRSELESRTEFIKTQLADLAIDNRGYVASLYADVAQFVIGKPFEILQRKAAALADTEECRNPIEERCRWLCRSRAFDDVVAVCHGLCLSKSV
jgi:hypothetical protein